MVAVIIRAGRIVRRRPTKILDSIDEHFGQLDAVSLTPGKFSWVTLLSLMNWVFDIVAVWLCVWAVTDVLPGFRAVENNTTVLGVVLAFVTAKIVGTAQITPAGLGPVEAAMTGSLVAVGMTASSAFGVVFVYRIISFALITIIGWVTYFISVARGGMHVGSMSS